MKTIALIHTVKPVLNNFATRLKSKINDDVIIYEIYDDFLAINPATLGFFSKKNKRRLYNDIENCCLTDADMIVVTCSTLSPIVKDLRPFFDIPIIAIDDAMCEQAVLSGSRIRVIATAKSTIKPTIDKLEQFAQEKGKKIEITSSDYIEAYDSMKKADLESHDKLLCDVFLTIKDFDVIVLAQASMAHLAVISKEISGIKTLGSIDSCIEYVSNMIEDL